MKEGIESNPQLETVANVNMNPALFKPQVVLKHTARLGISLTGIVPSFCTKILTLSMKFKF